MSFKGRLPYDAQYVGSYQPLLGWRSRTNKQWIGRQAAKAMKALLADIERDQRKLRCTAFKGGFVDSGPRLLYDNAFRWLREPLLLDKGAALRRLVVAIEEGKRKPSYEDLQQLLKILSAPESSKAPSGDKEETKSTKAIGEVRRGQIVKGQVEKQLKALQDLLTNLDKFPADLFAHAFESQAKHYKHALASISHLLKPGSEITLEEGYRLSPIGLLNLYRHYFYDLGNFLSLPIEHIWVAPNSELEFIEMWSQTSYRFLESETSVQIMQSQEETVTEATELSEQMQKKNEQNFKTGVTADFGYDVVVAQGKGTASVEYGTHLVTDKQTTRKRSSETSNKAVSEMKRSVRLLTRESVEVRTESSRRHLIKNPTNDIVSYEMRRKMQIVGIQMKHLGTQLCYQLIVDEPGNDLGLAELVHIAKPEDFSTIPPPDVAPPSYDLITEDFQFNIPFSPKNDKADDDNDYYNGEEEEGIFGTEGEINTSFEFQAPAPQPGYELASIIEKNFSGTNPEKDSPSLWDTEYQIINDDEGRFQVHLRRVNFQSQPAVQVTASLTWRVKEAVRTKAEDEYRNKMNEYEHAKQREAQQALVRGLHERINLARSITPRPATELRQEERTILYRRVLSKLLGPDLAREELHAQADLIRTYFEVDKMLYFVAPDWWNPRMNRNRGGITLPEELASAKVGSEQTPQSAKEPFCIRKEERLRKLQIDGYVHRRNPDENMIQYTYTLKEGQSWDSLHQLGGEQTGTVANPKNPNLAEMVAQFEWVFFTTNSSTGERTTHTIKVSESIPNPYYVASKPSATTQEGAVKQVLDPSFRVRFGREQEPRANNYFITEDSEPAPLGSSIGWLTQLDADAHRNAFLNAAWARIVIPIHRGREKAAVDWLKQPHVEGTDGLGDDLLDENLSKVTDSSGQPKKVEKFVTELLEELGAITDNQVFLEGQKVYEEGFVPIPESFEPGPKPFETFAQWVELVPTNQVVPVKYETS